MNRANINRKNGEIELARVLKVSESIENKATEITLEDAQKIFGYVNKSSYLDLLDIVFSGNEGKITNYYLKFANLWTTFLK